MQIGAILKRVESLPPLPRTVLEIEQYRKKVDKEIDELLKIVEKDALIVANLLKVANSAMFGFRSKVETPLRAISLLGINFTISIAISTSSQKLISTTLEPYGATNESFMRASNIASVLASVWLNKIDTNLKDEMILPALLIDIGKYIISDFLKSEKKDREFLGQIELQRDIQDVEKEFLGVTSTYITAQIFKHWKLSPNLISSIEYVDEIEKVDSEFKKKAQILDILRTAANIKDPMSKSSIEKALQKAKEYKMDIKILSDAITNIQERDENS